MLDIGTNLSDEIVASPEDDIIVLKAGDDTVDAGDGDDLIVAGKGDDSVDAGDGDDLLILGKGDDTANGGSGSDTILGGSGDDVFIFDATSIEDGSDYIDGGKDNDTLRIVYTDATEAELEADFVRLQAYLDSGDFSKSFHFEAVDLEIRNIENVELIDDTPPAPAVLVFDAADPLDFSMVFFGSEIRKLVTLTNTGGTAATEISLSFAEYPQTEQPFSPLIPVGAEVPEQYEPWVLADSIEADSSDEFVLSFQPNSIGTFETTMTVSYFDGYNYQAIEWDLIGQAI